jgi:hypothetical protein
MVSSWFLGGYILHTITLSEWYGFPFLLLFSFVWIFTFAIFGITLEDWMRKNWDIANEVRDKR